MVEVAELIDQGIKAYVSGRVGEALRSFQEVLERDPGNPRARSYLLLIHGGAAGMVPDASPGPEVRRAAVPLPAPAGGVPGATHALPAPARALAAGGRRRLRTLALGRGAGRGRHLRARAQRGPGPHRGGRQVRPSTA